MLAIEICNDTLIGEASDDEAAEAEVAGLFYNAQKMFTKRHRCKSALLVGCGCVG